MKYIEMNISRFVIVIGAFSSKSIFFFLENLIIFWYFVLQIKTQLEYKAYYTLKGFNLIILYCKFKYTMMNLYRAKTTQNKVRLANYL